MARWWRPTIAATAPSTIASRPSLADTITSRGGPKVTQTKRGATRVQALRRELQRHDSDAVHCKACGTLLNIPDEGRF